MSILTSIEASITVQFVVIQLGWYRYVEAIMHWSSLWSVHDSNFERATDAALLDPGGQLDLVLVHI